MNILICERITDLNLYVKYLTIAYQNRGHNAILGVQNFLFSSFLPDFIHIQWPEAIFRWRYKLPENKDTLELLNNRLLYYSKARVPIVYTAHNLLPHENVTEFIKQVYKTILLYADIIVHHGRASVSILNNTFPESRNKQNIICPFGPYFLKPYSYNTKDWQKARLTYKLPLSKYIFLNFGNQRLYKGSGFIKKVFRKLNDSSCYLFTIGPKVKDREERNIVSKIFKLLEDRVELNFNENSLFLSKNIRSILKNIPNEEIPRILAATDVFFLGHQDGLNSAIIPLAITHGKPVIYPELGNFGEQLDGWIWKESYEAGNIDSAIEAIKRMGKRLLNYTPGNIYFDNKKWLESKSWDKHVSKILSAVENITHK
jgi:hypothetical protein